MAAVAANDYTDAQPLRGFGEAARLITQLARQQKQHRPFLGDS